MVLCARPGIGAVTLALLSFSLIAGIWMLVQGIELRRTGETPDPAAREKTPPRASPPPAWSTVT